MYVLYARSFLLLTFLPEFDPWQGGLGNLKPLILVGWSGWGPMWQARNLWLFQVWRRNIFIPEKPVYSVWKYLTLPGSNSTSRPGKLQNPHPTKARFKFCTFRRTFVSNSLHPSRLRQSNTRGLPGGRREGKGGGSDDSSNRWAHYCAHSNELKRSNV